MKKNAILFGQSELCLYFWCIEKQFKNRKMKFDRKTVEEIVDRSLNNCNVTDYPSVSVSVTSFGTSIYIQNSSKKLRFSDHSVTNIDRIINEEHFNLETINDVDEDIRRYFSDNYVTLKLKNGNSTINFHRQIKKSEIENWKPAKIFYKEIVERAVRIEDMDKINIVKEKCLTKKGDKMICDIEVVKYSFGAYNVITGEVDRTRYPVESFEIEINL